MQTNDGASGKILLCEYTAGAGDDRNAADVQRLFAETKKAIGSVDVLVNIAGVYQFGQVQVVSKAEPNPAFNIDVLGVILAMQEAVKRLPVAEGGKAIEMSDSIESKGRKKTVFEAPTSLRTSTCLSHALIEITGALRQFLTEIFPLFPGKVRAKPLFRKQ
jgi:NAD(P)-dependent dehydrogenase (short-subunit alcohol dehydrogenase family)